MLQDLKIIALVTSLGRKKKKGDRREKEARKGTNTLIDHVVFLRSVADVLVPHEEAAAASS